jgi:hypothetical protein
MHVWVCLDTTEETVYGVYTEKGKAAVEKLFFNRAAETCRKIIARYRGWYDDCNRDRSEKLTRINEINQQLGEVNQCIDTLLREELSSLTAGVAAITKQADSYMREIALLESRLRSASEGKYVESFIAEFFTTRYKWEKHDVANNIISVSNTGGRT